MLRLARKALTTKPVISGFGCGSGALAFALITPSKKVLKTDAVQFEIKREEKVPPSKSKKFTVADLWEFLKTHKTTLAVSILCALAAAYFNIQIQLNSHQRAYFYVFLLK